MPKGTCSIDGCETPQYARGWCHMHYTRWRRHGDARYTVPTSEERFWERVRRGRPDECWPWLGRVQARYGLLSYGRFTLGRRQVYAHRYAYELATGPVPDGLELDHLCRNPLCCNPAHLEPVTHRENMLRSVSPPAIHARKTHCPFGHAYDEANTRILSGGRRSCRECERRRNREYKARRKQ